MLTLHGMYTGNGITKEHSISYQEYNYPVALEFLELAERFGNKDGKEWKKRLTTATQNFLAFFTRQNGEFFPLGDSFRRPNSLIRSSHPEVIPPPDLLSRIGTTGHRIMCIDGFFAYVRRDARPHTHFVATCTWHSANHKQDDDLSFCLELNGKLIFDDSGYTDFGTRETSTTLRNSDQHSAIRIDGAPYRRRTDADASSKILHYAERAGGFNMAATHSRICGARITRTFELSETSLHLNDHISVDETLGIERCSLHDFVLAPGIRGNIAGPLLHLSTSEGEIGILVSHANDGVWTEQHILHIPFKRSETGQTTRFTYRAPICSNRRFSFIYYGI